jgi:hypothetical protein
MSPIPAIALAAGLDSPTLHLLAHPWLMAEQRVLGLASLAILFLAWPPYQAMNLDLASGLSFLGRRLREL